MTARRTLAALVVLLAAAGCSTEPSAPQAGAATTTLTLPGPPPEAPPPPGGVTGDQIVAAWEAAGLAAPDPRDNTAGNCAPSPDGLGCVELLTTDVASVYRWNPGDPLLGQFLAAGAPNVTQVGPVTAVRWATGGTTPPYDRTAMEAVLVDLADG